MRATLYLEDAGIVELRVGREVERYTNLLELFERILALVGDGYGKLAPAADVHRLALRIAARQVGQPTDAEHLRQYKEMIVMREALDELRAEILADPAFGGTECRRWASMVDSRGE